MNERKPPLKLLSIIIPCLNEEDSIAEIIARCLAADTLGLDIEILVVDDGSQDRSPGIVKDLEEKDPQIRLVRQARNLGKGAAIRRGFSLAMGDLMLVQDADLEYDPAQYGALLTPVDGQNADVVIGSRFLAPTYVRVHYFWHLVGNKFLTLIFNMLYNLTFTDIYSCYLLYRRNLIDPEKLRSDGWEQHAEILCYAARRGDRLYEVPISYAGRTYDEGKKIRFWHALPVLWMIVSRRFSSSG